MNVKTKKLELSFLIAGKAVAKQNEVKTLQHNQEMLKQEAGLT